MSIVLNVAHLPSAASFFLSTLQPLGYRFQYRRGDRIGLGIHDADFFLQQSSDSSRHSPEHIRFHAPTRASVRECYAAALYAGSRPLHTPANRINRIGNREIDVFNTFVMDHDGNNIEVTYTHDDDAAGSFAESEVNSSSIRGWQRGVADNYAPSRAATDVQTYTSRRRSMSKAEQSLATAQRSIAESADQSHTTKRTSARSMTAPIAPPPPPPEGMPVPSIVGKLAGPIDTMLGPVEGISGSIPKKTVVGTMLGAAAGAAFAYAMCQSEDGKTTRERWRYVKWDHEGQPQYTDHEGTGPISQATPSLPAQMSKLAIESAPPRSRASGPPMAYERYETKSRATAQSDVDSSSRHRSTSRSSAHTSPATHRSASAHTAPASHRSSSRASHSQSVRESSRHPTERGTSVTRRSSVPPSAHTGQRDNSMSRRSSVPPSAHTSQRDASVSRRSSVPPSAHTSHRDRSTTRHSSIPPSTHASRREASRHSTTRYSHHSPKSSRSPTEAPPSVHSTEHSAPASRHSTSKPSASHHSTSKYSPSKHSASRHSAVTAIRSTPKQSTVIDPSQSLVDEPSDMELDLDDETVVPSDSISCAGDKYSRRSAGRSAKNGSASGSNRGSAYRSSRYSGGDMRSFHDRIIDIERASGSGEAPLSARRVTRMVY